MPASCETVEHTSCGTNVGLREIISRIQDRQSGDLSDRIAHAIAKIQRSRMAAFSVAMKGIERGADVFRSKRDDLHFGGAKEVAQIGPEFALKARRQHHSGLYHRGS